MGASRIAFSDCLRTRSARVKIQFPVHQKLSALKPLDFKQKRSGQSELKILVSVVRFRPRPPEHPEARPSRWAFVFLGGPSRADFWVVWSLTDYLQTAVQGFVPCSQRQNRQTRAAGLSVTSRKCAGRWRWSERGQARGIGHLCKCFCKIGAPFQRPLRCLSGVFLLPRQKIGYVLVFLTKRRKRHQNAKQ